MLKDHEFHQAAKRPFKLQLGTVLTPSPISASTEFPRVAQAGFYHDKKNPKKTTVFHLALHHSLQLMNRLGSAKSGAELYHHSAAALTQERRGDQAITIEGTTLAQLCTYTSPKNNKIPVFFAILTMLVVGVRVPVCLLEMCMGTQGSSALCPSSSVDFQAWKINFI